MGRTSSTTHPGIFHDMHLLLPFDDKTVRRIGDVQICGFDLFSRITAIRKDSKNENSTHSSLLESEVLFLFFYCRRQRYSRNSHERNGVSHKAFCMPCFFSKKRAVLRSLKAILNPQCYSAASVLGSSKGLTSISSTSNSRAAFGAIAWLPRAP